MILVVVLAKKLANASVPWTKYCTRVDPEICGKVPYFNILMPIALFLYTNKHNLCRIEIWFLNLSKFNDVILNDAMAKSDRATQCTSMKKLFHHCYQAHWLKIQCHSLSK